ncbi:MAG: hypothetical protein PHQ43_13765, partial [Dehalococcoidales bacterium]|nr:hypothetical protein [Dehalococcoidales bacterium]
MLDNTADQVQINAAISAANGGIVQILGKSVSISDDITLNANGTWLRGEGRSVTVITAAAASNAQIHISTNNCILSDLTVDQNGPDQNADWCVRI